MTSKSLSANTEENIQGRILKYKLFLKSFACSENIENYNMAYRQEMAVPRNHRF